MANSGHPNHHSDTQILLELNNEHKLNDRELFVQILTNKHCDFIVNIAKFIQKAMVKRNSRVFK